jgi:hypothetical protein
VAVTRAIAQAGQLLDISLLDHIVIGDNSRYVSLKERGLGFDGKLNEPPGIYRVREMEVIYTYTRSQALADGVLVDVSPMAAQLPRHPRDHIDLHTAETNVASAHSQSYEGRYGMCCSGFLAAASLGQPGGVLRQPGCLPGQPWSRTSAYAAPVAAYRSRRCR